MNSNQAPDENGDFHQKEKRNDHQNQTLDERNKDVYLISPEILVGEFDENQEPQNQMMEEHTAEGRDQNEMMDVPVLTEEKKDHPNQMKNEGNKDVYLIGPEILVSELEENEEPQNQTNELPTLKRTDFRLKTNMIAPDKNENNKLKTPRKTVGNTKENKLDNGFTPKQKKSLSNAFFNATAQLAKVYPAFKRKESQCTEDNDNPDLNIWQALRDNMHEELDFLLKRWKDPLSDVDSAGFSALHLASKYNKVPIIKVLLKHKAVIDLPGPYDETPLHLAAKNNSLDAVRLLLAYEANVMSTDAKHKTPLHHAARRGNLEVCKILLDSNKYDINTVDEDELTVLHEAVIHKQTNVVPLLLDRGVDIFKLDINETMAFQYATCEELLDVMESLSFKAFNIGGTEAKNKLLTHTDNEGNNALHMAVQNNKIKATEALLKAGSPVNNKNATRYTALHVACVNGNSDIVQLLLNYDAALEIRDKEFMTPIHRAAMYNRYQVINLLMKKGGNINCRNKDLMTPLVVACWKGHMETAQFLLSNGGQITECDVNMKSALHWSVETGHLNVLLMLLEHGGANMLECPDYRDQTVLHYAAKRGDLMILRTLLRYKSVIDARDEDGKTPLHVAAEYDNDNVIDELIKASQGELNDGDTDGRTPLILACKYGNYQSVKSLLSHGADITFRDENSATALMLASTEGHFKVIKILLDNLAEINATDKLKNTALHLCSKNGHVDCVKLLLSRNASPVLKNNYGKTPLDLAVDFGQTDVSVAFLKHKTWRESMDVQDKNGYSPMDSLIQKAPEAALVVMDNCMEHSNERKDDVNYTIKYDYRYIDPGPDDLSSKRRRYFAPNTMVQYNRDELLSHPLVQSILIMKWRKFGRVMFYFNLILYFLFLLCMMIYVVIMPKITTSLLDTVRKCPITLTAAQLSNQTIVDYFVQNGQIANMIIDSPFLISLQIILVSLSYILFAQQIFLFFTSGWRYFLDIYNYITWLMLITTAYFVNPLFYFPCEDQWRSGWVASIIAWGLFMNYLKQLDQVGLYFVMFTEVLFSVAKVFVVLALFLMSFATGFSITMAQTNGFQRTDIFPLTVLAMMLGEINYIDNFASLGNSPFNADNYIIIFVFMIVMPIALMNLLVGIAVGDIDKIQQNAYITRLSLQIDQIYGGETRLLKWFQRRWHQLTFEMKPNADKSTLWYRVKKNILNMKEPGSNGCFISADEDDPMKETVDQLRSEMIKQRHQLSQMQSLMKQQQEMLKQMGEHFHVEYKLDTISVTDTIRPDSRMEM